jgi:hypothetical protein
MIHTDDSCIPTDSAPQISGASDDLLHQLKKKSEAEAVPNSPKRQRRHRLTQGMYSTWNVTAYSNKAFKFGLTCITHMCSSHNYTHEG